MPVFYPYPAPEDEAAIIRSGNADNWLIAAYNKPIADAGLYLGTRQHVVDVILDDLLYDVRVSKLGLAGVLKIAAETSLPAGMTVREYKRQLFKEMKASQDGNVRVVYIAAYEIYRLQHRSDPLGIRPTYPVPTNSKLAVWDVQEIRSLSEWMDVKSIADEYGVSDQTIYNIINGVSWQHV